MSNKKLLVIVVTYNAIKWANQCFDSLRQSSIFNDVFVVDNGSKDGTIQYIEQNYPEVILIKSANNLGFGKANNLGFKYAIDHGYEYVYLLNQDAWVLPDTFKDLIILSLSNPGYGIISPIQMQANMQNVDNNFGACLSLWPYSKDFINAVCLNKNSEIFPVRYEMAAHWLLSLECIKKVGAFSPIFSHYGEDDNYVQRVHYHGFGVGVARGVYAVHDREKRIETSKKMEYLNYVKILNDYSNIYDGPNLKFVHALYYTFSSIYYMRNLKPLKYIYLLLIKINTVRHNKKISRTRGAFLYK